MTTGQVDDLTDFIENGLYDPAHVIYDPNSTTPSFALNVRDLTYSKYRPDLAALGAKDGFVLSGLAIDDNDPLTRRDEGLEFLDVTSRLGVSVSHSNSGTGDRKDVINLTNTSKPQVRIPGVIDSASVIDTNLLIVVKGLDPRVKLINASGTTKAGEPYLRVFLQNGVLVAGQRITQELRFAGGHGAPSAKYTLDFLSGQGKP